METTKPHFQIPDLSSSKRALDQEIQDDQHEKGDIEKRIQNSRKKIEARGSFDASYWTGHKEVTELELRRHALVRRICKNSFVLDGGKEQEWSEQSKAKSLKEEENTLELKKRVLGEHVQSLTFPQHDQARNHRKWIMELLTSTPTTKGGMGIGDTAGQSRRLTEGLPKIRALPGRSSRELAIASIRMRGLNSNGVLSSVPGSGKAA
ncbi:hypothetical protein MMC13_004661 [Lambiella insularis]|nr:hypothetical protein [Lambiella insularis]